MRAVGLVTLLALGLAAFAGCGADVDPEKLDQQVAADLSVDGYQSWPVVVTPGGFVPGHEDSIRKIYANPVAQAYPHGGRYPVGTVLVKEIWRRKSDGTQGDLGYIAIMRKVGADAEVDAPVFGGWVFSDVSDASGIGHKTERSLDLCWDTCHRAAPWDGAWLDYGQ